MLAVILVIGCLLSGRLQVQASYATFCSGDDCFIKPDSDSISKNWDDAQLWCKKLNSTLAIPDKSDLQRHFEEALKRFNLNDGVWIGGKATYTESKNWKWVDGTSYIAPTDLQGQSSFENSYAFLNQTDSISAYASPASVPYPYVCQYPASAQVCKTSDIHDVFSVDRNCYILYGDGLSWFSARNMCLSFDGDLATFSSLSNITFPKRGPYWVGLRSSWWNWTNPITNESNDITFSKWSDRQPDGNIPSCISIDEGRLTWRDWNCTLILNFLCQKVNQSGITTTEATQPTSSSTFSTSSFSLTSPSNSTQSAGSNVIALAVGIGVGVGVPLVIAVVVIIVVVVVKRNRGKRHQNGKGIVTNNKVKASVDKELTETESSSQFNDSHGEYAGIKMVKNIEDDSKAGPASNPSTVYAGLGFNDDS